MVARKERAGAYLLLILVVMVAGDSRVMSANVKRVLIPLVPAILLVGIDGIRYLYDRSGRRRLAAQRDRLTSMTEADAEVLLAGLLEAGNTGMGVPAVHRITHRSLLSEACSTMCQCGRVGTLFRFSQQADGLPEPPQPILIEFQPLPLPRGPSGRVTDRGVPIQGDAYGTSTVEMAVQRQSATSGRTTAIFIALAL
ncbi:MAG: hypothetical protein JXO22_03570, partial [Phycisphaerae bacterium]|nr:hypothetical protein [Phycisphaerae bacterium]